MQTGSSNLQDAINERRAELFKEARDAQNLLENPKIKGFFEQERDKTIKALKSMPMESPHAHYMALKIYLDQIDDFEKSLKQYIRRYEDFEAVNDGGFA